MLDPVASTGKLRSACASRCCSAGEGGAARNRSEVGPVEEFGVDAEAGGEFLLAVACAIAASGRCRSGMGVARPRLVVSPRSRRETGTTARGASRHGVAVLTGSCGVGGERLPQWFVGWRPNAATASSGGVVGVASAKKLRQAQEVGPPRRGADADSRQSGQVEGEGADGGDRVASELLDAREPAGSGDEPTDQVLPVGVRRARGAGDGHRVGSPACSTRAASPRLARSTIVASLGSSSVSDSPIGRAVRSISSSRSAT